ncbi:MAG: hypothetical protein DCC55_18860 [Chloroflexi bacterium]|nr:MAG: hypothetical protein DCC55_18860 [Chloroflexota bacterium]
MQATFDVTCAIPRSGRTFENILARFRALGADSREVEQILDITARSKALSSTDYCEAARFLDAAVREIPCFGLFVDRKRRHRPYRVGFLGHEWTFDGVRVRVEGEEPHNGSSLIRLDEIDCAVVGLDELLTMTQYYLGDPTAVTKWGMYNYHLDKPTDIRIAGSAQLTRYNPVLRQDVQDIVGFFLISKPSSRFHAPEAEPTGRGRRRSQPYPRDFLAHLERDGRRVFVKGRYQGVVATAYPELKVVPVEDVEDAVVEEGPGSVGLEVVQTGNTLKNKGLLLHGAPLFLSESLWVADYRRYLKNEALQRFIQHVEPVGYFDDERIRHFALWYLALEINLGDTWINRPPVTTLFCEQKDVNHGLRPYRLQTRYWRPDDNYKQDEAIALVERSRLKLRDYYERYKAELGNSLV